MCMGKKVRLNPRKVSQKLHRPPRGLVILPVIFGHQKNRPASIGRTAPPKST